jgi:hypothetical protein
MYVQGLQELLLESFLSADLSGLTPQTFIQLDRFYRTVSATLRAKRALKQLLDEQNFLPDLARDAFPLCIAEFTDRRISPYAYYAQANESFVPQLLPKNRAITGSHDHGEASPRDYPPFADNRQPITGDYLLIAGSPPESRSTVYPFTEHCLRI